MHVLAEHHVSKWVTRICRSLATLHLCGSVSRKRRACPRALGEIELEGNGNGLGARRFFSGSFLSSCALPTTDVVGVISPSSLSLCGELS